MINREKIDELFRFLLAGVAAPVDDRRVRFTQSQQLLSAFNRIDDYNLRQELIVLIEIVSKMPDILQRTYESWGQTRPAHFH